MLTFVVKRICLALIVALAVSAIAFVLLRLSGDPAMAMAGESASTADIEAIRQAHGFDRPLIQQYLDWLGQTLNGHPGISVYYKSEVLDLVIQKSPATFALAISALCTALFVSLPLGIAAAVFQNTWADRAILTFALIGQALPNFFLGLLMILVFSIMLRWLPVSGSGTWMHFIMPTLTLAVYVLPAFLRLVRSGMINVLAADYVRTARAKGLSPARVIFKHALRNALVPVVALAAVQLGYLLGGSVVTETIFALDGLGYLAYQSILHADFPVIQFVVMALSIIYVLLTLLSDIANAWLDPRVRGSLV